jgi:hypothetical protein
VYVTVVWLSKNECTAYSMKTGLRSTSSRRIKCDRYTYDCLLVGAPSKKRRWVLIFVGGLWNIWVDRRLIVSATRHFKTFLPLFDFYRTLF